MRIYPSAWTQGRQAIAEFDLDGYHFPAGTILMFSQWALHRLPAIWGDPEVFRPERWDPATGQKAPHWAYFPFGGGQRICIGMPLAQLEAQLVTATVLQRYNPTTRARLPSRPPTADYAPSKARPPHDPGTCSDARNEAGICQG